MNKSQKIGAFVSTVVNKCIKYNVGFHLVPMPYVMADGLKCSGYFDEKELVVASNKKDWLDVLVHESCHFDQFTEKHKLWNVADSDLTTFDKWLNGKKIPINRVLECVKHIVELELDCEKRSIKKFKKFNFTFINTEKYIQQANSYLFGYWVAVKNKKWYPMPYNNPNIVKAMPKTFLPLKYYFDNNTSLLKYYV
jgi:hypothetical protein